ncbi:MAG TPA: hypothetical protein VNO21_09010 [Polyangiaceae bacterium]|nr:hypothetical protein [Polyangiaceae bacterium]
MDSMGARRWLAIGLFGIAGSGAAFGLGATLATKLEQHAQSVSIAKIPVSDLIHPSSAPARTAVAKK